MKIKYSGRSFILAAGILFLAFLFSLSTIHAASLPTGFDTTLSFIQFDPADPDTTSSGINGVFGDTIGGTAASSGFSGDSVTAGDPNPRQPVFTDITDGFSFNGGTGTGISHSGADDNGDPVPEEYMTGIDFELVLTNNSADTYAVTVKVDYSHWVDADGDDAFARSEFSFGPTALPDQYFSGIVSDTIYGDEIDGDLIVPNEYGETQSASDILYLTYILASGGGTETLFGSWTGDGGLYAFDTKSSLNFQAFITIDSLEKQGVDPVPEPTAFLLLGFGLLGIAGVSRKKRRG